MNEFIDTHAHLDFPEFAADLADRHYVIDHGSIADMISRDQLASSREKLNHYLGV